MLNQALYQFGRPVVGLYARLMLNMDVLWHVPFPEGPKIIAPNHPSTTDPFLITLLSPEHTSILINETLFKVPMFGRYLRLAGHVPVVHGNGRVAYEEARRLLGVGRNVVVFPEGAISPLDGGFHKPHTGVARLALSAGAPVIPVGIHLQRERMRLVETMVDGRPEVGTWYLRGPYAVTVGEPMLLGGDIEDREYVRSTTKRIMRHIVWLAQQSVHRLNQKGRRAVPIPVTTARRNGALGPKWTRESTRWSGDVPVCAGDPARRRTLSGVDAVGSPSPV